MAGRGSMGVGTGIAIFVSSLLAVAFLVLAAVFFTKWSDSKQQLQQARADMTDFVNAAERNRDDVRQLVTQAKSARASVVGYLSDQYGTAMTRVSGVKSMTVAQLEDSLKSVKGAEGNKPMLALIAERDAQIKSLENAVKQADEARATANSNLQNESERVKAIETSHAGTIAALNNEVGQYKTEAAEYRAGIDAYRAKIEEQAEKERNAAAEEKGRLAAQIKKLNDENLILKDQLLALRDARKNETLRGGDEYALIDATVIGVDGAQRQAFIGLGGKDKVRIGMSFTVYADANAARPDKDGNLPRGKATLEIVNVGESSSTCRITSETRGNPVVQGDVVVNAFYDPRKVYKMVIYGNFDVNRDSVATSLESNDLEALVREWGGKVVADLSGDVDFLVLGEKPVLPPNPPQDAPVEVFQEYIRLSRLVERYDQLYAQARSTSVPILNENRLYTLIGKTPVGRR